MSEPQTQLLPEEEAIAMLPESDRVHTYTENGFGADWDRADIVAVIRDSSRRERTGPMATAMGHGLVVWRENGRPLFVATREEVPE